MLLQFREAIVSNDNLFKLRQFLLDVILQSVRWYLRYNLSYRNLGEMLGERGIAVDHSTIYRWVQRYAPELDKRCRKHLKMTHASGDWIKQSSKSRVNDVIFSEQ